MADGQGALAALGGGGEVSRVVKARWSRKDVNIYFLYSD